MTSGGLRSCWGWICPFGGTMQREPGRTDSMAMAYEGKSPSPGDAKSGREYASLVGQKAEHVVLPPSAPRKVYWVDLNRFDQKTDKSTWIEMARAMSRCGYDVTVLSGCSEAARREGAYQGSEVKCFPAVD